MRDENIKALEKLTEEELEERIENHRRIHFNARTQREQDNNLVHYVKALIEYKRRYGESYTPKLDYIKWRLKE